jgi:pyruvate formate lyase activating enzyme
MNTWLQRLPIVALTPFTLQDFPDRSAGIIWFNGCNMSCPYCHNPDLARGRGKRLQWEIVQRWLQNHKGLVDGVVLSGGECTLHPGIVSFAEYIRLCGYLVKLDTNGSRPNVLRAMLQQETVDYVAMDYKAPLDRYDGMTGWGNVELWRQSLQLLIEYNVDCELRCTVHPELLSEDDVNRMLEELSAMGYSGRFYLQHFIPGVTLGKVSPPRRRFDLRRLNSVPGVEVRLRNFMDYEAHAFRLRAAAQQRE